MRFYLILIAIFLFNPCFAQKFVKDTTLILSENIYFDFGKDFIRSSEFSKLNSLAETLKIKQDGFIKLTGHTDSIGTNNNNLSLSERRNNSVIQYLVNKNIAPYSFITRYNGEFIPVADNDTEAGRQKNRRVEISVYQIITQEIIIAQPSSIPSTKPIQKEESIVEEKKTLPLTFIIKNEETNEFINDAIITETQLDKKLNTNNGTWKGNLNLELSTPYVFGIYAKGFFHNSYDLEINNYESQTIEIKLKPIKKGNKLALRKLYFYGNQAKLLPKSMPELRRLVESVLLNPDVLLEVGGHINYPNTHPDDVPKWSQDLSIRRAEVIHNYLINSGVNAKQLKYKGYSNTQMINPTAREEKDMKPNRRVEIKVLGYINE